MLDKNIIRMAKELHRKKERLICAVEEHGFMRKSHQALIDRTLQCGASKAAILSREKIVLNAEYRSMCEANRCGVYGKCYMCPPDVGPVQALMERLRQYEWGMLYQIITPLEDSFDIEGMTAARKNLVQVSQKLHCYLPELLGEPFLHLTAGGCGLCSVCGKVTDEPCRHPERALASLESYGVDVSGTAANTPLRYINGQNTITYFGMVLFHDKSDA